MLFDIRPMDLDDPRDLEYFVAGEQTTEQENGLSLEEGSADREAHRRELVEFVTGQTCKATLCLESESGQRAGIVWVSTLDHGEPWDVGCPYAWIYDVRVEPAHRRSGFGKRLLESAEAWSAEQDFARIGLHALASNQPAVRLYESAGYETRNAYFQKMLEPGTSADSHSVPQREIERIPDADASWVRALVQARFARLAQSTGTADPQEVERLYSAYETAYGSRERDEIVFAAHNQDGEPIGVAWGYVSSGDLTADRYVWVRDLCVSDPQEPSGMLERLLEHVEDWARQRELPTVRVPVHRMETGLWKALETRNYDATNLFS